jgi:polysaccharide export outer membrane protein
MRIFTKVAMTAALVVGLSGCAMLPGSGPREQSIHANAAAASKNEEATLGYDYVVVDVTRSTLPFMSQDAQGQFQTFGVSARGAPSIRLGPGDEIRVSVFESQTGGLFLPDDAGARPGNFVQLPRQRIDQEGRISVPFAGVVQAAGRTTSEVERIIRERLVDRAIEPEISVEIVEQNFSRVSVVGEVNGPGVFPLREGGLRVLEALAQAGSITGNDSSTYVTLRRGDASVKVAYSAITANPRENIYLAPGDVLEVSDEDKTFFAFGATGAVGDFDFGAAELDLNEAVSLVSSLQDNRADPRQVLIYRKESRHALEKMGVDFSETELHGHEIPTIFRANYRSPDIFFLAKEFKMRDGDVVFVTNAASVEFQRFFNNAASLTGGPLQVRNNVEAY